MIDYMYDSFRVLSEVYGAGTYLSQALGAVPIEETNRPVTARVCMGVCERDYELSYYLGALAKKSPKAAVRVILKISMYLLKYMEKPAYAVTDSAVELLKKMGKGGMGGFVNAFLRNFAKGVELPADPFARRCVLLSAPPFAVKRLAAEYGEGADEILKPRKSETFVRFSKETDGARYLAERGIAAEITPFPGLYAAPGFRRDEGYDRGEYTFQSVGSVAVSAAVEGGGRLLDCCAAPGGKSVLLSEKFERVTACELHPHRAELIRSYARRMGRENIEVRVCDSSLPDPALGQFDAVLCDAPCSGYGVLSDRPDIRILRAERSLAELTAIQKNILNAAAERVKPGGALYYSTCSVFPEENREQAEAFLASHPAFSAEIPSSPLAHVVSGAGLQFLPHISMGAGFYLAKFRRKE